jgi:hypothetical protein
MALTDAQKLSVFECLGITYGAGGGSAANTATIHNGFGESLTLTEMDTLRTAVTDHLDNLVSAVETKVAALVVEWDNVRIKVGAIQGNVGSLQGVTYSFEDARKLIKEQMMVYVPVMHIQDSIRRRQGEAPVYISLSGGR